MDGGAAIEEALHRSSGASCGTDEASLRRRLEARLAAFAGSHWGLGIDILLLWVREVPGEHAEAEPLRGGGPAEADPLPWALSLATRTHGGCRRLRIVDLAVREGAPGKALSSQPLSLA